MSEKLLVNSLSGIILYFVNIVTVFIMSPFLIRTLGNSNYGIWEVILGIVGYMGVLDLGVGPAIVRFVSVAHSHDDRAELGRIVSSAFLFFLFVGVMAALLLGYIGMFPEYLVKTEEYRYTQVTTILLMFAVNVAVNFPAMVFTGTLMGLQRHYLINTTRIVLNITKAIAVYIFLTRQPAGGLIILILIELAGNLVQMAVFGGVIFLESNIPRISLRNCSLQTMKELWAFGAKNVVMMLASRLQFQAMPIIIGKIMGVEKVVFFVMPRKIVDYARGVSTTLGFPLTPYFASLVGKSDQVALRDNWLKTSLALQIVSHAMVLALLFCGEMFLRLWLGDQYADAGRVILFVMLIGLAFESLVPNASSVLVAANLHGKFAYLSLLISAFAVLFAVVSAKFWGLIGVALGGTSTSIALSILGLWFAVHALQVGFIQYIRRCTLPLLMPLLTMSCLLWLSGRLFPVHGYLKIALQLFVSGVGYLTAVWFLVLDLDIRGRIKGNILEFLA